MKIDELNERGLYVNEYGKVFDENLNEYRNEKGEIEILEGDDLFIFDVWKNQNTDIKEGLLE